MALFYIHLQNGHGFIADEVGRDCPTEEAARKEAICAGADIMADELKHGCSTVRLTLFVEDHNHVPLMQLAMSSTIAA